MAESNFAMCLPALRTVLLPHYQHAEQASLILTFDIKKRRMTIERHLGHRGGRKRWEIIGRLFLSPLPSPSDDTFY